jgi:GT2 family glycosyltransferase
MISAATVQYDTPDLVLRAYESIRAFYPEIIITIIDGSSNAPIKEDKYTRVYKMDYNIGHGPGMHLALINSDTKYLLLFDSDTELKKPCIDDMLSCFKDSEFAVGEIQIVDKSAYGIEFSEDMYTIPLVHPFFHIVNVEEYFNYLPYSQSGGPVGLTTLDIYSRRLSDVKLIDFPVRKYVNHLWGGTRSRLPLDMYKCQFTFTQPINNYLLNNWRKSAN